MWCDRCRADAAANVSAETGRALCATCGSELGLVRRPSTDEARELLRRWSTDLDLGGNAHPEPKIEAAALESSPTVALKPELRPSEAVPFRRTESRVSSASPAEPIIHHMSAPSPSDAPESPSLPEKGDQDMFESRKPRRGVTGRWPAPSVQLAPRWPRPTGSQRGSVGQIFGQLLAYLGILAVTGGTALVIWGYFGGPADYAPTGWLVAAGGQMLLFLGVVTLVSEGLEKSSRDMQTQVELLDQRLERIERNAAKTAIQARVNPGATTPEAAHIREAVSA